jgi:polar amino acid transport system substrate-binding protein
MMEHSVARSTLSRLAVALAAISVVAFAAPADAGETLKKITGTKKVTVGTEAAFPPFEFVKDGKIVGYGKDILDHVVAGLGAELNQLDVPFQGILPGLLAGKFDFIATTVLITPERVSKFAFTMPIAEGGAAYMKRRGDGRINGLDDLNGKIVATQLGTSTEKYMREHDEALKKQGKSGYKELKLFTAIPEAILALANGQVDAVGSLLPNLAVVVKERQGAFEIVGTMQPDKTWLAWVARPDDTDLRDYINGKIKELRDTGKLYELQQKWFGMRMEIPDRGYLPAGAL